MRSQAVSVMASSVSWGLDAYAINSDIRCVFLFWTFDSDSFMN